MRIAVVGSRDWTYPRIVQQVVAGFPPGTVVVSGGARGVDKMAENAARAAGLEVDIYLADWDGQGKRAGFIRNKLIVENCDAVIAFHDGRSAGTAHTIGIARMRSIPVQVLLLEHFIG